ncbi:hypothetical protein CDD82_4165 [Ophiocordyceps australis]|uniref:LRR-containing protein second PH domain-containing protein n=1 Tax=Ophiocordyceps australis TaxID=1399860 RepID=A0A2C5Z9D9_9HYPO|nr:hypothetical protein CDD82_4165 [Ophiocordyceps australis]
MSTERWKWRTSSGLAIGHSKNPHLLEPEKGALPESAEGKTPRVLTRALRSLSGSSMDSSATNSLRSSSSMRRLQKSPSASGSVIGRLHRRLSRGSGGASAFVSDSPGSPAETHQPYSAVEIIRYGPLKADISLLKARSEYLVLSEQSVVKFASAEAARSAFPQLSNQTKLNALDALAPSHNALPSKAPSADVRLDIPLHSIVAVFNEDGSHHRSGIEIWWFSQWPRIAYCKAHLHFSLPQEREDWLAAIHRACRERLRRSPGMSFIPENFKKRVNSLVRQAEGQLGGDGQVLIFPVARRVFGPTQRVSTADDAPENVDSASFYLAIGPCMCHFLELLKTDQTKLPSDLRVKLTSYGTVTMTRFKASVASHEQRFVVCFRAPFGRETRLDLASVQYRRIIEALTKADRNLKPMWPQYFQQVIFDIKGLPPPLQLTSGNDLGGLETSLQAYCTAYHVQVPSWKIEWNTPPQPAFRLLPPTDEAAYSPLQLLAVFRALRYNSYFKAISFRNVDLSPLTSKKDEFQCGDSLSYRSLNGNSISEEHLELLVQASVLEQEVHALTFASESIRSIDMSNILGLQSLKPRQSRLQCDYDDLRARSSEVIRPILMLWKQQSCVCHSLVLSGNPIASQEVEDLATLLMHGTVHARKIHLARCALGDAELSTLWKSFAGQAQSLENIDTSENHGSVKFSAIKETLGRLKRVARLNIAGNTRITCDESLFEGAALNHWALQELDVSGVKLNDATVNTLAAYVETESAQMLQCLRLNNCSLTGAQLSRLFRGMGQARRLELCINANQLDQGIDDLCQAISCSFGPSSLFLQMLEFRCETSLTKLLRALTVNKSIECLSLAGMAIPEAASSTACQVIAEFFARNDTVRFLDISGYDSKLDEGRLGREFSRALIGVKSNVRLEHLRVRSQMLNINIGDLAEAMSGNKTMRTLDCEGNDFNLSNFKHIIKHLEDNETICFLSMFSESELACAINKSIQTASTASPMRRASVLSRFRHDKSVAETGKFLVQQLQDEWDAAVSDLKRILNRNRQIFQAKEQTRPEYREGDAESTMSAAFGGLAPQDDEFRRVQSSRYCVSLPPLVFTEAATLAIPCTLEESITRPISTVSSEAAMSRSTDGASTGGIPSPPELDSPMDGECSAKQGRSRIAVVDEPRDGHYVIYSDGFDGEGGLQMKRYRRLMSSSAGRIDEEDGTVGDEDTAKLGG